MPEEIRNHIASYLSLNNRETDEEFLARCKRIRAEENIPGKKEKITEFKGKQGIIKFEFIPHYISYTDEINFYAKNNKTNKINLASNSIRSSQLYTRAYAVSPDCSKIFYVDNRGDAGAAEKTIFDLKSVGTSIKVPSFNCLVTSNGFSDSVAVSSDGNAVALSYRFLNKQKDKSEHYLHVIDLLKKTEPSIPLSFTPVSTHFNKQGTKLLVLGAIEDEKYEHLLVTQDEHKRKTEKTLNEYLYKNVICKGYAKKP